MMLEPKRIGAAVARVLAMFGAAVAVLAFMPGVAEGYAAPTGMLAGSVISADGRASAGARVTVLAWPDEDVQNAVPMDGSVQLKQIGSTVADTAGNYALSPDLSALSSEYRSVRSGVDVEIRVSDRSAWQLWNATLMPGVAQSIVFDMATQQVRSSAEARPEALAAIEAPADDAPAADSIPVCTPWQGKGYLDNRPEKFVHAYGRPYAPVTVEEVTGSAHSLGLALSVDGGGYEAHGGTTQETSSSAGGSATYSYGREIFNQVNYRHWHMECTGYGSHDFDEVKGAGFNDLQSHWNPLPIARAYHYCAIKAAGTHSWKTQGSGLTFEAGVTLPYFSLSSHAEYNQQTKLEWVMTHRMWLCAPTPRGWVTAYNAAARPIPSTPPGCQPPGPCAVPASSPRR